MPLEHELDRGELAATAFGQIARHMTHDQETVTRVSDSVSVLALADPSKYVWQETEGGGREMIQMTVYVTEQDLLDVGDQVTTDDDHTWKIVEADRERLYGHVMGDAFILERLFGG